jgi:alpha-mannosidase
MENEYLRVRINSNGTLDLTDKRTGKEFRGLHYFEDSGEAGHAWARVAPEYDKVLNSLGCQARIALEDDGLLSTTFSVSVSMEIPVGLENDRLRRSANTTSLDITSLITLRRGARRVDITTRFFNNAKEHRLRVVFSTGLENAIVTHADTPFDVVARPIKREDTSEWEEPAPVTHPFSTFVDVSDGERGLALLCRGLHEYEVSDDPERAIALTLLRAFEMALCTVTFRWERLPEQEGSQCLREHCFQYAIYPHKGDWASAEVIRETLDHNLSFRVAQCGGRYKGSMPKEHGFLSISPANLILSGIKKCEKRNSFIVRIFNPTEKNIRGKIRSAFDIKRARLVNFNEQAIKDLDLGASRTLSIDVAEKKIVSVEISLKRSGR